MMVPTDDGGHIPARHGDFVEVFCNEVKTLVPHQSIDHSINLGPGYNFPYGRITIEQSFQLSWVQLSGIQAIVLIQITCSRARSWIWIWTDRSHAI
jgi:hypothetical protein